MWHISSLLFCIRFDIWAVAGSNCNLLQISQSQSHTHTPIEREKDSKCVRVCGRKSGENECYSWRRDEMKWIRFDEISPRRITTINEVIGHESLQSVIGFVYTFRHKLKVYTLFSLTRCTRASVVVVIKQNALLLFDLVLRNSCSNLFDTFDLLLKLYLAHRRDEKERAREQECVRCKEIAYKMGFTCIDSILLE